MKGPNDFFIGSEDYNYAAGLFILILCLHQVYLTVIATDFLLWASQDGGKKLWKSSDISKLKQGGVSFFFFFWQFTDL